MKLLHSISRNYIGSAIAVLILFTVAIYFIVNSMLDHDLNQRLHSMKSRIVNSYPGGALRIFPFVEIEPVASMPPGKSSILRDTVIYNEREHEDEVFREYISYHELQQVPHKITVRLSLIEKEDMISAFGLMFGISSVFLLIALFVLNKKTTSAIFAPFYTTLSLLQNFSLRTTTPFVPEATEIEEFAELNAIVSGLVTRARKEYSSIKEFSENASHELQTPLAIVKSKLDLLIQKENLDDEEKQWIESMYQNVGRLTHLNKALLLLSQIETAGYFESSELDFARELRSELDTIAPIAEFKHVAITCSLVASLPVRANPVLINILIKNILSNAIRHNNEHGSMAVRLDARTFSVENTGPAPTTETANLFDRFRKESPSADSVGLGLAVVKEICTLYHYGITYEFVRGVHSVTVTF
jgi:signal transduction histidine kinase